MAEEFKIDDTIDITDVVCPTTFVKAKVALEELEEGQILSIYPSERRRTGAERAAQHQGRGTRNLETRRQPGRHLHAHREEGRRLNCGARPQGV